MGPQIRNQVHSLNLGALEQCGTREQCTLDGITLLSHALVRKVLVQISIPPTTGSGRVTYE